MNRACELANQHEADLSLVHVIEPIPAYGYPGITDIESPIIEQAKKTMVQLGEKYLIPSNKQHITFGATKREVLELAKKISTESMPVDLIITGSHGRHGLALLLGSTADAIVHGAKCDVLIVRYKNVQQ